MPAGYTRQAAAQIQAGLRANAEDVDAEYDALARAFDNAAGHDHSGAVAGDGAKISLTAGVVGVLPIANGGTGSSGGTAPVFANAQFNPGGVLIGAAGSIPGAGQLTLNANTVAPAAGLGAGAYVVGANNTAAILALDSYSANVGDSAQIQGRRARGTPGAPAPVQAGDNLLYIGAVGRGSTSYSNQGTISFTANEAWSDAARGTALQLTTTPNGTTGAVNSLILAGNGATFSGAVTCSGMTIGGNLTVNGGSGIAYSGFGGGGSDGGGHSYRFGWSGSHLVVSVDGTSGLQLANAGDLSGYLPLGGGTVSNLTVSNGLTVNGSGTAINVPNGAVISGTFFQANASSGTALYAPSGNAVIGGGITVTGNLGGGLSIHATNGIEADLFGSAFYAPNGNVVCVECHANAFVNTSDEALKTGIADSGVGLDAVMRLAPKTFRWKDSERDALGLIAQDVADVLPEAVSTTGGGELHEPLMGIDYAMITTALVGAVQELHVLLKALEAKCSTPA